MKKQSHIRTTSDNSPAFAKVDLLALIVFLFLSAGMLASAAKTKTSSRAVECLANKGRLARAWSLFTLDNNGQMPGSIHGGLAQNPVANMTYSGQLVYPWAQGWLDWTSRSDNTNFSILTDPRYASLATYVQKEKRVYKCPSDNYISDYQREFGIKHRVRSVAGNLAVGAGNGGPGDGPWNYDYFKATKISDLGKPGPADVFVLIDEHPDAINDGAFFSPYGNLTDGGWDIVDVPGNLHNGSATVSFADGRAEIHAWEDPILRQVPVVRRGGTLPADPSPTDAQWLYLHTPRY